MGRLQKCWQQRKYATYETQIVKNEDGHMVDGIESVFIIKAIQQLTTNRGEHEYTA